MFYATFKKICYKTDSQSQYHGSGDHPLTLNFQISVVATIEM